MERNNAFCSDFLGGSKAKFRNASHGMTVHNIRRPLAQCFCKPWHKWIPAFIVQLSCQFCAHGPPWIDWLETPYLKSFHLFAWCIAECCGREYPDLMACLELRLGNVPDHLLGSTPVVKRESSQYVRDFHLKSLLNRCLADSQEYLKRPYAYRFQSLPGSCIMR